MTVGEGKPVERAQGNADPNQRAHAQPRKVKPSHWASFQRDKFSSPSKTSKEAPKVQLGVTSVFKFRPGDGRSSAEADRTGSSKHSRSFL